MHVTTDVWFHDMTEEEFRAVNPPPELVYLQVHNPPEKSYTTGKTVVGGLTYYWITRDGVILSDLFTHAGGAAYEQTKT